MNRRKTILVRLISLLCGLGLAVTGYGQLDTTKHSYVFPHPWYHKDSARVFLYFASRRGCKSFLIDSMSVPDPRVIDAAWIPDVVGRRPRPQRVPFLKIHGNFNYSFDYRSVLDTPFETTNLQEHREQVYADATLKGKYPFRVIVSSRQSNSPFFKNYTDVNVEFKQPAYKQAIKENMVAEMKARVQAQDSLGKYEQELNGLRSQLLSLNRWLNDPARQQEVVQEKERLYQQVLALGKKEAGGVAGKDSTGGSSDSSVARKRDSLMALIKEPGLLEKKMQAARTSGDSLMKAIAGTKFQSDSAHGKEDSTIRSLENKIRNAKSVGDLETAGREAGANGLSAADKRLLGITHFNVGRAGVNYSDLTVNNISLTGVNIEYNPGYYAAFAAGSVDYLFRDYVVAPGSMPKQNLVLGRFGWGDRNRKSYILTVYTGTKNSYGGNSIVVPASGQSVSTMSIFGYSIEGRYRVDANMVLSLEAAKSSSPYPAGGDKGKSFGDAFAFNHADNQAYSAKLDYSIPATHSTFNLFYREMGANFQSYTLFSTGNRQTNWGIKWRQVFFKNQLTMTAQIKKSSFDDPLIASTYSSTVLLKSLQLVWRRKKWPLLSVAYMPTSQLMKDATGNVIENVYYALTGTAVYTYSVKKVRMSSSVIYSQFYNRGTDSGFVLYDARSILYTHQVFLGPVNLQTDVQYNEQPSLDYWMWQQGINIRIGKFVSVGGSLKNDLVPGNGDQYWGGMLQGQVNFKKLGGIRLQYSKDYISNGTGSLVPYNWGRANWIKVF
jgi:hypothetical protein